MTSLVRCTTNSVWHYPEPLFFAHVANVASRSELDPKLNDVQTQRSVVLSTLYFFTAMDAERHRRMRSTGHIRRRSKGSWELRYSRGTDPATGKRLVVTTTIRGDR